MAELVQSANSVGGLCALPEPPKFILPGVVTPLPHYAQHEKAPQAVMRPARPSPHKSGLTEHPANIADVTPRVGPVLLRAMKRSLAVRAGIAEFIHSHKDGQVNRRCLGGVFDLHNSDSRLCDRRQIPDRDESLPEAGHGKSTVGRPKTLDRARAPTSRMPARVLLLAPAQSGQTHDTAMKAVDSRQHIAISCKSSRA